MAGEDIAKCPSCSLVIRVVFEPDALDAFAWGGARTEDSSAAGTNAVF